MINPQEEDILPIQPLITYFEKFVSLPEAMKKLIIKETTTIVYKKNKFIVSPIDLEDAVYFIVKGAVRGFVKDSGQQITTWISVEDNIVGAFSNDSPFKVEKNDYIQAIEETEVIVIPYQLIETLYLSFHEMSIIGRKVLKFHYHESKERNFMIRLPTTERRLARLRQTHPHLLNRIPLQHLASYLGVRIETLSRLRSRIGRDSHS